MSGIGRGARRRATQGILGSGQLPGTKLAQPRNLILEQAIAYIQDDELVEVTPQSIRLRKR